MGTTQQPPIVFGTIPGSPPRAWGQPKGESDEDREVRITPTCVGTTVKCDFTWPSKKDHPHVRGDNQAVNCIDALHEGSPPRAWGQRGDAVEIHSADRITPTCVGTTDHQDCGNGDKKDHPHVRGDNAETFCTANIQFGSPPRAWGQPTRWAFSSDRLRITPTCVGTTSSLRPVQWPGKDHPHVRGDNIAHLSCRDCHVGSPPRAWGQHTRRGFFQRSGRITPTCVGTTVEGKNHDLDT